MTLEDYRADMLRCTRCSYCKWIPFDQMKSHRFAKGCPSIEYNRFQPYSAGGRLAAALSILEGRTTYTEKFKDITYNCLLCGSCDVACKVCRYDMEPLEAMYELRMKLVADSQVNPQHVAVVNSVRQEGNLLMKTRSERVNWFKDLDVQVLNDKPSETVFFAGCKYNYDAEKQNVARAAVTLLRDSGIDFSIMGNDETCCGGRVYGMGYREEFIQCAHSNIEAWKKSGVKTVITCCADCYHAFKRLYPKVNAQIEVLHIVEVIDHLIKQGKIKLSRTVPLRVTYHDPCHLGRQGEAYVPWNGKEKKIHGQMVVYEPRRPRYNGAFGIYNPPRDILKAIPGIELIEMERIKEYAWCCGAGGGVKEAYPEFSLWTARERIEEAGTTGAEAIVSACPWCEDNLAGAIKSTSGELKIYDIVELVQQSI